MKETVFVLSILFLFGGSNQDLKNENEELLQQIEEHKAKNAELKEVAEKLENCN